MKITTALMLVGVMAIPAWYAYRTVTDKRFTRIDWGLLLTEDQRREKEIEDKKRNADEAAEAERQRLQAESQKAEAEAAKAKEETAKAAARKSVETKFETCRAAARAAESSYQTYLAERVRYRNFTEAILQAPPPAHPS
jgi:nucleosome binding factor SPN SPT16 subunit